MHRRYIFFYLSRDYKLIKEIIFDCFSLGIVIPGRSCKLAMGLESGIIPDAKITASSKWNSAHRAANGRLHLKKGSGRTGAWSARFNSPNQWLQVDFGKMAKLDALATQGRPGVNQWVTKYTLSYSRDGIFWDHYPKVWTLYTMLEI